METITLTPPNVTESDDGLTISIWDGNIAGSNLTPYLNVLPNVSVSDYTFNISSGGTGATGSGGIYSVSAIGANISSPYSNTMIGSDTISLGDWGDLKPSNKLSVTGENADIEINGVSLMDTLRGIQDRLAILTPNPEMEKEWDELRELGERYREMEKQCQEKSKMWGKLKSMPRIDPRDL